ncbi:MAG: iron ABC transporter substrate-binding protein, partial [Xanthobacteraceae bacterium]
MLLYVLAPEKLIGWVRKPSPAELEFLNPKVRQLPEIGRLTGRGDTANLEVVIKAKPDVIIDFGTVNPTYVSLADRVQAQTGIPYLLIDGRLASTAASMKLVGNILGVDVRANALADQA